jgi:CBS domain-containing protein
VTANFRNQDTIMNVADYCQREIVTIPADAPLREAAALMRKNHVGALVVTDSVEPARVVGVVTDRDLAIEIMARDLDVASICIGQLAGPSLVAVPGAASVYEAVASMEEEGVRRLLVTDNDGRVFGFLSADDLVEAIAAELSGLARALRRGIARESEERSGLTGSSSPPMFLPPGLPGMH